jgi:hypothetical protein
MYSSSDSAPLLLAGEKKEKMGGERVEREEKGRTGLTELFGLFNFFLRKNLEKQRQEQQT